MPREDWSQWEAFDAVVPFLPPGCQPQKCWKKSVQEMGYPEPRIRILRAAWYNDALPPTASLSLVIVMVLWQQVEDNPWSVLQVFAGPPDNVQLLPYQHVAEAALPT